MASQPKRRFDRRGTDDAVSQEMVGQPVPQIRGGSGYVAESHSAHPSCEQDNCEQDNCEQDNCEQDKRMVISRRPGVGPADFLRPISDESGCGQARRQR
jgi:hypothetical protein